MFGGGGYSDARDVEFYDIAAHDKGFLIGSEQSIAFFAPFYFDRWNPSELRGDVRRSIMFVNSVVDRLRSLPCDRTNETLVFDGVIWAADSVAADALRRASCLWLGFHEYFHSAGPLPLFSADLDKLSLGKTYGFIEECRADMSGFVAMAEFGSLFSGDEAVAQKCMLADRMTRSLFRTSLSDTSRRRAVSEVEVGRFWASTLIQGGALTIERDHVTIDTNLAVPAIVDRLQKIYACEVQAAEQGPEEGYASLTEFATNARESMLCSADDWGRMRTIFLAT